MKKNIKIIIPICLVGMILCGLIAIYAYKNWPVVNSPDTRPLLLAHAMGGIEGEKYSNSLEAFERNYELGFRVYEADFSITSDNVIVLRHDWTKDYGQEGLIKEKGVAPTYEEFKSTPMYGKYTPLSFADMLNLMKEHEDIYIVTDSKEADYDKVVEQFKLMLATAEENDALSCLDRFIVQIYNDEMYDAVTSVYPFKSFIYTVYKRGTDNFEQLCKFCVEKNIPIITINHKKYKEEFQALCDEYGLEIYVHTLNDQKLVPGFVEAGVDGFYTDFIPPAYFHWTRALKRAVYDFLAP